MLATASHAQAPSPVSTKPHRYHHLRWLLVIAAALLVAQIAAVTSGALSAAWAQSLVPGPAGLVFWLAATTMATLGLAMLVWRVALVARYRPVESVNDDELPEITVIVPAYNEGAQVLRTLRSLLASDYPAHKLNLVAVDDGSQDDTWSWIRAAAAEAPDRIQAVHYAINRGKRHALSQGFRRSRGIVIVTVDSDSEVEHDTLRNLVSPFVLDARIGAVAGNVRVLNYDGGIIPRMMDVVFTYGFDFVRASQSEVNTVMCTPGALSAYRRSVAMEVEDEWLHQQFLGRPAGIGEDRAMTNLILREGFHVTFQGNAIVHTEVPTRLAPLCRMLLRWARSNLRESLVMARFVFRRFRATSTTGARLKYSYSIVRLGWSIGMWLPTMALALLHPGLGALMMLGAAVAGSLAPAAVHALLRDRRHSLWAFPYSVYSIIALSWITPYALLTLQKNGWLTRRLASAAVIPIRAEAASAPIVFDADAA